MSEQPTIKLLPQPNLQPDDAVVNEAISRKWLYPLEGTPLLAFGPEMTQLLTALRVILVKDVARREKFREWLFPRMVPEEVLAKTGWLTNHREEAWLVDPKREFQFQADEPELFPRHAKFPSEPLPYALDPIQCVSLYYALFNRKFEPTDLPLRVFEYQGGWSHRYETAAKGLYRGIEFMRLELVWIASEREAITIRNKVLDETAGVLAEKFGLKVHVVESDSCFEEAAAPYDPNTIGARDALMHYHPFQSVDLLVDCGGTDIEVVSAARHSFLASRFKMTAHDAAGHALDVWSGCLGVGLTRVAAAFLAEHSFDSTRWPDGVKLQIAELEGE